MASRNNTFLFITFLFSVSIVCGQSNDSLLTKSTTVLDKKFYYQLGAGFNFASGIGTFRNHIENDDFSTSDNNFTGSFGKGFDIAFGLGHKLTQSFGIEVEVGYTRGSGNIEENQYFFTTSAMPPIINQTVSNRANTLRINPKLLFEVPFKKVNAFYSKLGYMFGTGNGKVSIEETWNYQGYDGKGTFEWKQTGGMVSGSTMALGLRFLVDKDISFFMEITGMNAYRKFKKSSLIESIVNNNNTIDFSPVYYKEIIFVDELHTEPNSLDLTKPREVLAFRSNYSNVGFRIGFISHF